MSLALEKTLCISCSCRQVPVHSLGQTDLQEDESWKLGSTWDSIWQALITFVVTWDDLCFFWSRSNLQARRQKFPTVWTPNPKVYPSWVTAKHCYSNLLHVANKIQDISHAELSHSLKIFFLLQLDTYFWGHLRVCLGIQLKSWCKFNLRHFLSSQDSIPGKQIWPVLYFFTNEVLK